MINSTAVHRGLLAALCWVPLVCGAPSSADLYATVGSQSGPEAGPELAAELVERFAAVNSWRGEFVQTLTDINGNPQQLVAGHFALQQPNLIDWHYAAPLNQRLVSDGTTLWFYDRDLEQVSVRPVDELLLQSPAAILLGQLPLGDGYRYRVERSGQATDYTVVGSGSTDSGVSISEFTLAWQGDQLLSLTLLDGLGQRTVLSFGAIERNPELAVEQFRFSPPEGVDVVH